MRFVSSICLPLSAIKILLGLYNIDGGNVTYQLKSYDKSISYVQNSNYIFNGTIEENICMSQYIDTEKMISCAKKANAHVFINELEQGYKQLIGEGNKELSSGQGQRIAIARALYKDAETIILDEPTSNLDVESIKYLHNQLTNIKKDKTIIIATHDINTINICDRVLNIQDGELKEIEKNEVKQFIEIE